MKEYEIRRYEAADYTAWNSFINEAKNATFLFHRDFMEYHSDRFEDHSLIIFFNHKVVAVLAAHKVEDEVYSHKGLTYGGLAVGPKAKLPEVVAMFREILKFLNDIGFSKIHIKMIPDIYCKKPAGELHYAMFLADAKLTRRDSLSVIDNSLNYYPSKDRRKCALKGERNGLIIKEDLNFDGFWNEVLIPNMLQKHAVRPVHSLNEIKMLSQKFPENIRHFNVYLDEKLVAGTTVFVADQVAHPQYISGNENKNELGSLDYLYNYLITKIFRDKKFFDFGISNEMDGRKLNHGLVFWKESFGASTVIQDFYSVDTAAYSKLEKFLV